MNPIIDAHEDLAANMLGCGRNYLLSAMQTRALEKESPHIIEATGQSLLGWEDYQKGQIAIVFSTLYLTPRQWHKHDWDSQFFSTPDEANYLHHQQIDAYEKLADENPQHFTLLRRYSQVENLLAGWKDSPAVYPENMHTVGLVMLMEGADSIRTEEDLERFIDRGVRIFGVVWGGNRFCGGHRAPGPFSDEGRQLLKILAKNNAALDVSHMSDQSIVEALETYAGVILASHANARALLGDTPSQRNFTDDSIKRLADRGGVMGIVPSNPFLSAGWHKGTDRSSVTLDSVTAQIDHVCQVTGSDKHVALGTDYDGGIGWPDVPMEIDSIADLQKLESNLASRGYNPLQIANIFYQNWQRILERTLPE